MADTSSAPTNGSKVASERGQEETYYECGAGRKLFFSIAFVLLLPFYISLPVMLYQRFSVGLWVDTVQLTVLALVFTILMVLILFELIFSLRSEVNVGKKAVSFTLPSGGGGVTPWLPYETRRIPYEEIKEIETRREIFGGSVAPMMMKSVRIITKSGEPIPLGRANERDDDPKFPFPTIAQQIATRAGVDVVDRGNIMREFHRRMFGLSQRSELTHDLEIEDLNRRHSTFLTILVFALVLLLMLGVFNDILRETSDSGEQGRNAFIEGGAAGPTRN
ncbi:MAG: hypothetical protein ACR2PG_10685 [Hyphomicrobiaceae bacterium]